MRKESHTGQWMWDPSGTGTTGGRREGVVVYPRPVDRLSDDVGEGPVGHVVDVELDGGEGREGVRSRGGVGVFVCVP